jgi:predicted flap endonuclease-1-like 5' DNA nuclease
MKRAGLLVGVVLVVLLLAAAAAPMAFAQGITGDKVVMGDNYVLAAGETLDGNLAVLGGTAEIENGATVRGDVSVLGGSLEVDGTVTGNVTVLGGSTQLNESAVIEGDLANLAGSVRRAPGAVVRGDTFNGFAPGRITPRGTTPFWGSERGTPQSWFSRFINWQLGTIGSILLMGLLGLVLVLVAPRAVGRVASAAAVQPALAFGIGFLTLILGLLAGALLLIACGLGLLVWLALVAATVLGWIGVALWLGQRLLKALSMRSASAVAQVLVGVVLITLLSRLPCIGWLFSIVFGSLALGAVVLTRFGTQDADTPRPAAPVAPDLGGSGGAFALPAASGLSEAPVTGVEGAASGVTPAADAAGGVTPGPVAAERPLTDVAGIDAAIADRLRTAGIQTLAELASANAVELSALTGVPMEQIMAEDWIGQAQRLQ